MSNTREIPVHTSKVIVEISKKPTSFMHLQNTYALSPSTLSRDLKFLRKAGFIQVVIVPHDTRDGMRKAYELTGKGKKILPLFKKLDELENEILKMARE